MLEIASGCIDVTPDNNGIIGFKTPERALPPRDPLYGRIFLLRSKSNECAFISLDYGGLYLSAHDQWRSELAAELNIPVNQVIIHCVHQHDAPFVNIEAAELCGIKADWTWFDRVRKKVVHQAAELKKHYQSVTEIGWSEKRLHGYASNRRVPMSDGSIAVRYSRCSDPAVRDQPVGIIDPMLRTLGFFGCGGELLAAWNFYATHPQVANDGTRFGADAPGEAMRLLKERFPATVNSLFNGCFGNITAGKYSTMDFEYNIRHFGKLLADGITDNLRSMEKFPAEDILWQREVFAFPLRRFSAEEMEMRRRINPMIAAALIAGESYGAVHGEEYTLEMLSVGPVKIIFVNGELFVEYQLFAQSLIPDEKLALVGNCGDSFYYIGTAEALSNPAGYEVQSFCRALPEFEALFHNALRKLLTENTN